MEEMPRSAAVISKFRVFRARPAAEREPRGLEGALPGKLSDALLRREGFHPNRICLAVSAPD